MEHQELNEHEDLESPLFLLFALVVVGIIGGVFLEGRGFRATSTPSATEAVLARTMRNLAIPRKSAIVRIPLRKLRTARGRAANPFSRSAPAVTESTAAGKRPMGVNLYPRVPDLRAPATQNLTDGDIHYIIENEFS